MALRRCHTGNAPRSSSVNQALLPGRSASRTSVVEGFLSQLYLAVRAEKIVWLLPIPGPAPARQSGAPPTPPECPQSFRLILRGVVALLASSTRVKRVFQEQARL